MKLAFVCLFALCLLVLATQCNASRSSYMLTPNGNGKYHIPKYPSN